MPTAVDVRLRAPARFRPTPARLHGLACTLLEGPDVSHVAQSKPWSIWPLRRDASASGGHSGSVDVVLRINLLRDDAPQLVSRVLPPAVRIGGDHCVVVGSDVEAVSYETLLRSPPWTRVRMSFESPTTFSRNGRDVPLPDPVLVFGSLARRWTEHCADEARISDDFVARLMSTLLLLRMEGRTVEVGDPNRRGRVGFVGEATFALLPGAGPIDRAHLTALARAGEFLGVGRGTTRGQGVVAVEGV